MDLSLDDLIKKNKKIKKVVPKKKLSTSPGKATRKPLGAKKLPLKGKPSILDARNKIIQKKRHTIRDARDIIAENARKTIKDARELLSTKKAPQTQRNKIKPTVPRSRPIRSRVHTNDLLMEEDDIDMDELHVKPVGAIKRTVHNEMFRTAPPTMPKLPNFSINQDISRLSPDPFDCYVVPTRRPIPVPPLRPERIERFQTGRNISAHMDAYEPRKSILRSARSIEHDDRYDDDRYFGSGTDNVRSRLYNESRGRNESAGIFAKMPLRGNSPPAPEAQGGHRIIVSNLHTSVSESDVRELFEDIGALVSAQLVRPGIAEVVYKNLGDAEEAIETYHNRQLDGQPMKCMLVKSSAKPYSRL